METWNRRTLRPPSQASFDSPVVQVSLELLPALAGLAPRPACDLSADGDGVRELRAMVAAAARRVREAQVDEPIER